MWLQGGSISLTFSFRYLQSLLVTNQWRIQPPGGNRKGVPDLSYIPPPILQ